MINIFLICGIPGSGKDYIAKQRNLEIISYDNIRIKEFLKNKEHYPQLEMICDKNQIYKMAFKWCNEYNINLDNFLKEEIQKLSKIKNVKIGICSASVTKKSREKLIDIIKDISDNIKIHCIYIQTSLENAITRDLNRRPHDKTVGEDIIRKFYEKEELPTVDEKFESIEIYKN